MAMTYESMLRRYDVAKQRADKITREMQSRALRLAEAAGVGQALGTAGHNALIDYRAGRPWRDVDYSLLRQAFRVMESSYQPGRFLSRLWLRLHDEWRAGGFAYDARTGG